jgi:hypothetical protein
MMNSKIKMCFVLSGALVLSAAALQAQRRGPDGAGPFGGPMELMGFEGMHGGKTVKGAPFSATATSETTETLQDGSVIHRTSQVSMYRDSQGRSRREATFSGFGPLTASGTPKKLVSISDPVAGVHIMVDDDQKVARKSALRARGGSDADVQSGASFQARVQAREQKEEAAGLLKKESLGTQVINGVVAEGSRTTRIIPAGQIGNEKALQVVSERWYSPDLQIVLKSTRTDPRSGTTTYTVSNIQRTEPAASLFTVPAGYSIQVGGRGPGGPGGRGPIATPPTED